MYSEYKSEVFCFCHELFKWNSVELKYIWLEIYSRQSVGYIPFRHCGSTVQNILREKLETRFFDLENVEQIYNLVDSKSIYTGFTRKENVETSF